MRRLSGGLQALTVLLVSLLPIAGISVLYFILYVNSNKAYLTQRNYRALATVSRQITARLDGLREALEQAVKTCEAKPGDGLPLNYCVRERLLRVPNLEVVSDKDVDPGGKQACPSSERHASLTSGYLRIDSDASWLYFRDPLHTEVVYAKADLREIVEAQLAQGLFDDVLVAEKTGRIIYHQREMDNGSIPDLQKLLEAAKQTTTPKPDARVDTPNATVPTWPRGVAFNDVIQAQYLGEDYFIFFQPVRFSLAIMADSQENVAHTDSQENVPHTEWLLCGLVRAARFSGDAQNISPTLLSGLVLLLVIALLALPLLKLWHLGPRERLKALDVYVLVISCLFATGLITVFLLDTYTYRVLTQRFDQELKKFAQNIERHFDEELVQAYSVLENFKKDLEAANTSPCDVGESLKDGSYPYFSSLVWIRGEGTGKIPNCRWKADPVQGAGTQLQIQIKKDLPSQVNVSDRKYFIDARAGRLWHFNSKSAAHSGQAPARPICFAAELVQSRTAVENRLVLAIPLTNDVCQGGSERDKKPDVVMLSTRFLSLIQPVVPPSFGFAIVEDNGRVLLHSDVKRNLQENLFQECDNDRRLRSAVQARHAEPLDAQYYGEAYRLYTQPLRDTPWSVVVFRNKKPLQVINFGLIFAWVVMFGLYMAGYLVVMVVLQFVRRRYRAEWLWPKRARTGSYYLAAALLLLIAVVCFGVIQRDDMFTELTLIVMVPPLAVALLYLLLSQGRGTATWKQVLAGLVVAVTSLVVLAVSDCASDYRGMFVFLGAICICLDSFLLDGVLRHCGQHSERAFRTGYVVMLFGLLVVTTVGPAVILFSDAFEQGMVAFVRGGQLQSFQSLVDRAERAKSEYANMPGRAWLKRLNEPWDVYQVAFFVEPVPATPASPPTASHSAAAPVSGACSADSTTPWTAMNWLAERVCSGEEALAKHLESLPLRRSYLSTVFLPKLPLYTEAIGRLVEMVYGRASDEAWEWVGTPGARNGVNDVYGCVGDGVRKQEPPKERQMRFMLKDARLNALLTGGDNGSFHLQTTVQSFPTPAGHGWWFGILLVIAAWASLIFTLLWSIAGRVFLLHADEPGILDVSARRLPATLSIWLFLKPPGQTLKNLNACTLDLFDLTGPAECTALLNRSDVVASGVIIVDHFESRLDDPEWNQAKLSLLEHLVFRHDTALIVVSEVDPLYYFSARLADAPPAGGRDKALVEAIAKDFGRWAEVFGSFSKSCVLPPANPMTDSEVDSVTGTHLADVLAKKGREHAVGGWTEARYWTIWSQCTKAEKLALIQLAREGFLNPNNVDVARSLMQRQLIFRGPAFHLMRENFRRFVLQAEAPAAVAAWENEGGWSGWSKLRVPLLTLLVFGAVFFYTTQRGLFDATVGLVTALAGSLPLILRLFGMFGQERGRASEGV